MWPLIIGGLVALWAGGLGLLGLALCRMGGESDQRHMAALGPWLAQRRAERAVELARGTRGSGSGE